MTQQKSKKKVIIVGAGIAGLAASAHLLENNFDVTVLEARDRCGGRIYPDFSLGTPFGRGAAFIHGVEGNPVAELAAKTFSTMKASERENFAPFDRQSNRIPVEICKDFSSRFENWITQAKQTALANKDDISLSASLANIIKNENLTPIEQDLYQFNLYAIEGYLGANYRALSGKYWDSEEVLPGGNFFLTSSYQPILEKLQANCPVELNIVVNKIIYDKNEILVNTDKGTYQADIVILTVPLGVLKKSAITFAPPLPDSKLNAINKLGMGLLNITAMKFEKPFWPKEHSAMFFSNLDADSMAVFLNLHYYTGQPILAAFTGGDTALRLEKFSDEEVIHKILANFEKIFKTEIPEPEAYFNTRWSQDPSSYGSYSFLATGSSPADYDEMAEPVLDKIFFAGEATSSKYSATTHGAYLSGLREAERIVNLFL